MEEDEEPDERLLDWWSKYFASIEKLKEVIPAGFGESNGIFIALEGLTQTCGLLPQKLRAQEAAQAEAEDREDLEIAAELAGTPHHPSQAESCDITSSS